MIRPAENRFQPRPSDKSAAVAFVLILLILALGSLMIIVVTA